jgi:hypothetical protein
MNMPLHVKFLKTMYGLAVNNFLVVVALSAAAVVLSKDENGTEIF